MKKEQLTIWISPTTKVDVKVPPGTNKLINGLLAAENIRARKLAAAKVKSR